MFLAAGVLAGHESEIGHQRARRLEPTKVVQLRQDQDGRQGVDAPEAAQPRDRLSVRIRLRDLRQAGVEFDEPRLDLIDGQQVVLDHDALGRAASTSRLSIHWRCARVQFRPL